MKIQFFASDVKLELEKLREKDTNPVHSVHEGYAQILEEVDELWEEVRKKSKNRDYRSMYIELVQISARSQRLAEDIVVNRINKVV